MIPRGWRLAKLRDVALIKRGAGSQYLTYVPSELNGIRLIRISDFLGDDPKYVNHTTEIARFILKSNDILIAGTGATAGIVFKIPPEYVGFAHSYNAPCIRMIGDACPLYITYYLDSNEVKRQQKKLFTGNAQPFLDTAAIGNLRILLPSRAEQHKIAEILTCWDKAIELVERLIEEKRVAFTILRQSLISGTTRFPEFQGSQANVCRFDSFLTESRMAGSNGRTARKLTIKLYGKGIAPKSISREGSESTRYFRRKAGQFIYSKLDFLNGAFAIIPDQLDEYESTLDLPAFDISQSVNPQWLLHYVSRPEFYQNKLDIAAGGRKARRVNPADFLALDVKLPCRSEQDRISEVLERGLREIGLLEDYHGRLMDQKRGLMQKLLTGKIRVKA